MNNLTPKEIISQLHQKGFAVEIKDKYPQLTYIGVGNPPPKEEVRELISALYTKPIEVKNYLEVKQYLENNDKIKVS